MLSISNKPQQSWPAWKNIHTLYTRGKETAPLNKDEVTGLYVSPTLKSDNFSSLCFGQTLLTGISGQGQSDPTAAQQKPHLLTACILMRGDTDSHQYNTDLQSTHSLSIFHQTVCKNTVTITQH